MEITKNKRAYHDYKISDTFEAGLVLSGPEVKSIKKGSVNLKGAYISLDQNMEAYLVNTHVAAYKPAKTHQKDYDPHQPRKLLLNKKQISSLVGKQREKNISILPLRIYIKNRLIKLEIGIGTGKKKYDKREDVKKRDFERRKKKIM
jgi:SsrA-binding protein